MGLTLVEKVTRAHGGRFDIREGDLGGLEVTVWLPKDEPVTGPAGTE